MDHCRIIVLDGEDAGSIGLRRKEKSPIFVIVNLAVAVGKADKSQRKEREKVRW